MFIYLIVNHITGKYYVGQHKGKNLKKYLQDKLSHAKQEVSSGSHLYNSMRKHPKEAWTIHALLSDIQIRTELDQYEKGFIAFLRARDPNYGYNIALGGQGGGMLGHRQSSQTIEKIRKALAGKQCYPRTVENEQKRKVACQVSVKGRIASGHYFTDDVVSQIKEARAVQDEAYRCEKQKEYERLHPERRERAAATHRGMKHDMSEAASKAIADAARKTCEIRRSKLTLVGQRFGRLVVEAKSQKKTRFTWWDCRCDCGGSKTATTSCLHTGNVTSCGCLANEARRRNGQLHSSDSTLLN